MPLDRLITVFIFLGSTHLLENAHVFNDLLVHLIVCKSVVPEFINGSFIMLIIRK